VAPFPPTREDHFTFLNLILLFWFYRWWFLRCIVCSSCRRRGTKKRPWSSKGSSSSSGSHTSWAGWVNSVLDLIVDMNRQDSFTGHAWLVYVNFHCTAKRISGLKWFAAVLYYIVALVLQLQDN